ncbi:AraC family transcriptional regulator [Phenylobacterium sp.]|jgi:AraC-like DNA-binding protein|uniref:helix-turn-helix transcriptional regulator n=1 Tax=Phenylobacterium sp. TaxID=1871053 RepID=UPI002E37182B|nr:AraC family transcriptional regulator [Phenylobacterium sp.]HEX4710094.1 AraC family transcriptional regulator [Phenylobacterium sp.]
MAEPHGQGIEAHRRPRWTPAPSEWPDPNPSGVTTGRWARSWRRVSAVVNEMTFTGGFEVDRSFSADRLVVILDEVGDRIHGRSSARPTGPGPDTPHRLYLVPAGAPFWTFAERPKFLRFLSVQFARADLQTMAENASGVPASPRFAFQDPRLFALARVFEAECRADEPSDPLLGDSLALGLAALLSGPHPEPAASAYRGGLTARQVRIVTDYLESRLSESVDLVALAGVAGLSPSHFHRAFRASMGAPPHRWLTARRIRRAQELMLNPDKSLADVAIETGFADQPHFTRTFSRVLGVSPGAWRRAVL